MRNFKKFLALVLAMLMVSACAVSISAFDDVAGNKYASAIEKLADLGVISGRGDGKFYPNDTLTREEAAVFAAKLLAGANAPEWADQTTSFVDVDAAWSFPYINYAFKYKAMVGVGDNKFEPKRELQIDEAIKIALAVADPNALRQATIDMNANPTGYWADHFIIAAGAVGEDQGNLLEKLPVIRNYEEPCTRGMFAQIMANAFEYGDGIMESFGYISMKATVDAVTENDKKYVVITDTAPVEEGEDPFSIKVTDEFFTAALVAEGYTDITAADLEAGVKTNPCYLNIACLEKTKEIKSIEILTEIKVVKYDAGLIKVVKDSNDKLVETAIEIDGVKYTVNATDKTAAGAWGEEASTVRGIMLSLDGENQPKMTATTIPDFYEAFLYDDNGDGDYERAAIKTYYAGILVDAGKDETDLDKDNNKTEQLTSIQQYGKNAGPAAVDKWTKLVNTTFSGETATYGNTPVLFRVDGTNVDILEVAKTDIKGEVANFKEDNYINLGETKVEFAKAYLNPGKWVLGQNVAVYTIGGKYVDVVNEDVTTGMKEQTILVDNVTVENGVALIDGYMWNTTNGTLTAVTDFKVVGVESNDKLITKAYSALKIVDGDKTYAGLVGNGTVNDAGTGWKENVNEIDVFEEGHSYIFNVTNVGAYVVGEDTVRDLVKKESSNTHLKCEIKNGYFYKEVDGVVSAQFKMADAYTILVKNTVADAKDAYAKVVYKTQDTFKFDTSSTRVFDANMSSLTALSDKKTVALVLAVNASNTPVAGEQKKLNEGETIVKIYAVENEALAESTYLAQDIFTGEKVEVTGNAKAGYDYVVVKGGKIVDDKPLWIYDDEENDVFDAMSVDVTVAFDGKTIKGYNTMIIDPVDEDEPKYLGDVVPTDGAKATFTDIKYWVDDENADFAGDFKAGDPTTIFTATGTYTFTGCIIDGTVVVLDTPELVPAVIN